jgi:hypothetical protein
MLVELERHLRIHVRAQMQKQVGAYEAREQLDRERYEATHCDQLQEIGVVTRQHLVDGQTHRRGRRERHQLQHH